MLKNCYHCHNSLPKNTIYFSEINGVKKEFCCNGCKSVFELITISNSEYYYQIKGNDKSFSIEEDTLETSNIPEDLVLYNDYIKKNGSNLETSLVITNIHCTACIWLIENILNKEPGVIKARVNFSTGKLFIIWNENLTNLVSIIKLVKKFGYILKLPTNSVSMHDFNSKDLLIRLIVAAFGFGSLMAITTSLYAGFFQGIDSDVKKVFHILSWIIATPVYLFSGIPFLKSSANGLINKKLNMDVLLVLGLSLAYFYSVAVVFTNIGEIYFDTVCMIYTLVLTGKYLEANARKYAYSKVSSLLSNLPETSLIIRNGEEIRIACNEILVNDILIISSGERIPVDGILISNHCSIDESFLTGESKLINKTSGDLIYSGAICQGGLLKLRCTKIQKDSRLHSYQEKLEIASMEKPSIERLTDKIASYFIGVVFFVSILTFITTLSIGLGLEESLIRSIAVLIVACPCALGLAVPTTLTMNNYMNARRGIILKNPDSVRGLSLADIILLDKTGTITEGKLKLVESKVKNEKFLFPMLNLICKNSKHPVSKAIFEHTKEFVVNDDFQISNFREISGSGISAHVSTICSNNDIFIGNLKYIKEHYSTASYIPTKEVEKLGSIAHIIVNDYYFGYFLFDDVIRNGFVEEIIELKKEIKDIRIISGDNQSTVSDISKKLDIINYHSNMKPEEKKGILESLQNLGHTVIMVGDGVNDSEALAKSNVGISHYQGIDLAIEKSDIILMNNDLRGIRYAIQFAKLTDSKIKQNIIISFGYNLIMIPLAAFGYMQPVYCALLMSLSSLTVILNSFLLKFKMEKIK